jgi:divalent metal cation (Fe/Co/Zn/Cd) transporter
MLTSAIVIAGLVIVLVLSIPNADAYAALIIAALIIYTSLGLGRRTLDVLLDKAPKGTTAKVTEIVSGLQGVNRVYDIRARTVGQETFVDMHIEVPRTFTHDKAHRVATEVEERVKNKIPKSSILVHVDAVKTKDETILDRVRLIASETSNIKNIHSVYLSDMTSQLDSTQGKNRNVHLYLDVQMDANLDLASAHNIIDAFEKRVKSEIPEIKDITTHIETEINESVLVGSERTDINQEYLERIRQMVLSDPDVLDSKNIGIISIGGETHITLTITISGDGIRKITVEDAHRIATRIQNILINQTGATRVIIHTEPM